MMMTMMTRLWNKIFYKKPPDVITRNILGEISEYVMYPYDDKFGLSGKPVGKIHDGIGWIVLFENGTTSSSASHTEWKYIEKPPST
jgi:hypothetical protein